MKLHVPVCIALLAAAPLAMAGKTDDTPERSISVTGTATTRVAPDVIVWNLSTTDEDPELAAAKASSDRKLEAIMGLLDEFGIPRDDVQTGYVNVSREFDRDEHGNRTRFRGFSVRRGVTFKQRDFDRFDEYFSRLLASSEMEASFQFTSSEMEDLRWQTRLDATKLAQDKARAMVDVVGAKLGPVITLEESGPAQPMFEPMSNRSFMASDLAAKPDRVAGTLAPGTIEITVTVHAQFALE